MIYLKPPKYLNSLELEQRKDNSIFLAGSITGAWDWQDKAAERLLKYFNVVNPRRDNYSNLDPKMEEEQITWEHHYLEKVKYVLFYFSHETLAPITLFEYGCVLESLKRGEKKEVFVCVHPDYKRKRDVEIQTKLRCPPLAGAIAKDLDNLLFYIENYARYVKDKL